MTQEPEDDPLSGDVIPPISDAEESAGGNLLAVISNYTDRPDLLLAELEKHDPGFIKRMNAATEQRAQATEDKRLRFSEIQAYVALGLSVFTAVAIVAAVFFAISSKAGWMALIALAIFYAIAQSGTMGFLEIARAIKVLIGRKDDDDR